MAQSKCYVSGDGKGHVYMPLYDNFPDYVRDWLKETPFNICPACLVDEVDLYRMEFYRAGLPDLEEKILYKHALSKILFIIYHKERR